MFETIEATTRSLEESGYFADPGLATSLFLALRMEKALFLEGEPGVGKTEVARVLSRMLATPLIRLQCYEGLDVSQAVYEWNYPRQLLEIQARASSSAQPSQEARSGHRESGAAGDVFTEEFLIRRPLMQAIDAAHQKPPVLLIDELDRSDEEFESFLLELLDEFQITVPELGTFRAPQPPVTIITSNRTREIHDALKRRCVYHWIDYPEPDRELRIVRSRVPEADETLSKAVVRFVQRLRREDLYKLPGVAESLDWARALTHLSARELDPEVVNRTIGLLLKYQDDVDRVRGRLSEEILAEIGSDGGDAG